MILLFYVGSDLAELLSFNLRNKFSDLTFMPTRYILVGMKERTRDPERSKQIIVESALKQVHRKGFMAASLNDILPETGLTRGALYYHFPNKQALGLELLAWIEQQIKKTWVTPLEDCEDQLATLIGLVRSTCTAVGDDEICLGCPLNNLAQEMSAIDEDFRLRVAGIFDLWRQALAESLRRGQRNGQIHPAVDPLSTATFLVSAITGARGLAKTMKSKEVLTVCSDNLSRYLEMLRR